MYLKIITVGDKTNHGGTVISGSPEHGILGRAIARIGDQVDCPQFYSAGKPHGVNKITTASESYTIDGIPVAIEDCTTECGCKLIGSLPATMKEEDIINKLDSHTSGADATGTDEYTDAASITLIAAPTALKNPSPESARGRSSAALKSMARTFELSAFFSIIIGAAFSVTSWKNDIHKDGYDLVAILIVTTIKALLTAAVTALIVAAIVSIARFFSSKR